MPHRPHARRAAALLALLILSGCGTTAPAAQPRAVKPAIPVTTTTLAKGGETVADVSLPGIVAAEREVTVVSKASGTITKVAFDLGDTVGQDALLASIDEGKDSALRIASQSAVKAKMNALRAYDNADASTAAQVKQVELAISQAKAARELAATALRNAQTTTERTIRQAELAAEQARAGRAHANDAADASTESVSIVVERAENGLELAEENRDQKLAATEQSLRDLQDTARTTLVTTTSSMVTLLDSANLQTGLITGSGITPAYASDLGNQNPATKTDAQTKMTNAWTAAANARSQTLSGTVNDVQNGIALVGQVKEALDATKLMLESTTPTQALPLSAAQGGPSLTSLRGSIGGAQAQAAGTVTQLTSILQALRSLQATITGVRDSLDKAVTDAELQLDAAERGEDAAMIGASSQRDAAASGEALATNAVETARAGATAQLDAARLQVRLADLQVQNAEAAVALTRSGRTSQLDGIKAQIDLAQGQLDISSYQLSTLSIRAPIGGAVTRRFVSAGDTVAPGSPILTLSETGSLKVTFGVDQEDIASLSVGQRVTVRTQRGVSLSATIARISPTADVQTRKFLVEATLEPSAALSAGLVVDVIVRIRRTPSRAEGTVFLPLQAVTISQNETTVYVIENGKAAKLVVTIVHVEGDVVEVLASAPPDTRIITSGSPLLVVGATVQESTPLPASSTPPTRP